MISTIDFGASLPVVPNSAWLLLSEGKELKIL